MQGIKVPWQTPIVLMIMRASFNYCETVYTIIFFPHTKLHGEQKIKYINLISCMKQIAEYQTISIEHY